MHFLLSPFLVSQNCVLRWLSSICGTKAYSLHSLVMTLWRSGLADVTGVLLQGSPQVTAGVPGWRDRKHSLCLWSAGCRGVQAAWVLLLQALVSLPACGATLDRCHLRHVLTVAYLMYFFKMSTAAAPAGAGPRVTQLYTSGCTVKPWVYQPGTGDAEQSHCRYAGWTTIIVMT